MDSGQVIYEVTLRPDPSVEADFDVWLEHHVQEMLRLPGFVGARIHCGGDAEGAPAARTVRYVLRDHAALDAYLAQHAERMRAQGTERFGDKVSASRRVMDAGRDVSLSEAPSASCANCASPLFGQYCANCGQRTRDRMISLWELVKEASEILTSLESRLWRTLGILLFRPGRLTRDYLLGRRARYIPALRLFLGLSLLFFFLFSLDTHFTIDTGEEAGDDLALQVQIGDEQPSVPASGTETADEPVTAPEVEAPAPPAEPRGSEQEETCADVRVSWPEGMEWADRWLSTERLRAACEKIVADHGESFTRALLENIPAMMFIFVPLMAVVMKILYPLTGRYYAEHLLFLVHYHAFFYLLLSVALILGWLFDGEFLPQWPATVFFTFSAVYIPVYLFRAMRTVYQQGRLATTCKYTLLGVAYFTCLLLFLVGTVTITAVTI